MKVLLINIKYPDLQSYLDNVESVIIKNGMLHVVYEDWRVDEFNLSIYEVEID